jgi:hypothetical protein
MVESVGADIGLLAAATHANGNADGDTDANAEGEAMNREAKATANRNPDREAEAYTRLGIPNSAHFSAPSRASTRTLRTYGKCQYATPVRLTATPGAEQLA